MQPNRPRSAKQDHVAPVPQNLLPPQRQSEDAERGIRQRMRVYPQKLLKKKLHISGLNSESSPDSLDA